MSNKWLDIWIDEPPRNEDILFMLGNHNIHKGIVFGTEKIRKCIFHSFDDDMDYDCDRNSPLNLRVISWKQKG